MQLMQRRWDPFGAFENLNERFNHMFGLTRTRNGDKAIEVTDWTPAVNISETNDGYCIRAELPGIDKENVNVTLEGGVLTIQGQRREQKEEKDIRFHRRELVYGSFMRRFTMPEDADHGKIDATFKDGILEVTIGKNARPLEKSREIPVH